jgi:hypothetical protein
VWETRAPTASFYIMALNRPFSFGFPQSLYWPWLPPMRLPRRPSWTMPRLGTIKLDLGHIEAVANSVTGWFKGSIRSLRHAEPISRRRGCESGLGPGCTYIDRLWFGNRPDEHYEGGFHDGMPDEHGVYKWSDGSSYEGEFRDGRFDGPGVYIWPNGNSYVGEWEYGKPNGAGTFFTERGTFKGIWTDGCRGRIAVGNDAPSCRRLAKARQSNPAWYRAVLETRAAQRQLSALVGCVATAQKSDAPCDLTTRLPRGGMVTSN